METTKISFTELKNNLINDIALNYDDGFSPFLLENLNNSENVLELFDTFINTCYIYEPLPFINSLYRLKIAFKDIFDFDKKVDKIVKDYLIYIYCVLGETIDKDYLKENNFVELKFSEWDMWDISSAIQRTIKLFSIQEL